MTRFLIVRLGALGDIVHAIPVAAALRRAYPDARIDWLVSAKHREILDLVPVIDRRLVVNDRGDSQGGASLLGSIRELRRSRYDVALDLQGLIKSAVIARASGAGRVIGFASRYLREPLARLCYTDVHDPGGAGIYAQSETRHVVDINLGVLRTLGIEGAEAVFPFDETKSTVANDMLARTGPRYALLNPGAAWPNKRWPPDRLAAVARELHARHRLPSVVLWGPGERDLAEQVASLAPGAAFAVPQTTIADVVALARGAAVMVSGDTGPTHIGAAVGTPIVGLYGPTRPERNGPWLPQDITVSRADRCQCHHLRSCKLDRMCLLDIGVDEVLQAVERRLIAGMYAMSTPLSHRLAPLRVPIGFLFGGIVLWLAAPTAKTLIAGGAIGVVGESLRIWAAGHISKNREVTTSGPYRWFAHPLYVGSATIGVGLAIAAGSFVAAVCIVSYLAVALTAAIRSEEWFLRQKFGDEYGRYRDRGTVQAVADTAAGSRGSARRRFSLERALLNREHHTLAGFLLAVLLLVLKATYNDLLG